jgi:Glycosyl hydrolase catalytic core
MIMNKKVHFVTTLLLFFGFVASAQTIVWTGAAADNNFFTEANWKDSITNAIPAAGSINPATNISLVLQINSSATTITAAGVIQIGTGSLTVGSANLTATGFSGGSVTINDGGYVSLSSATPLANSVQVNFTSGIGWVRTTSYDASSVSANNLGQLKVNGSAAVYQTNLRLDHYYLTGCVIRANLASATPLTVYDGINKLGNSAGITVNTIHSGNAIAGSMNNKIKSFVLKKGFMATVAIEEDGTGKSKNYIASEADLTVNTLDVALRNSISFIRVMPWNWVTKKGRTDIETDLNSTWVYKWNNGFTTTLDWEYAPMSWGHTGANDAGDITLYVNKYNSTHVMGFNEPDDCSGQSGQYPGGPTQYKLCNEDVAVTYYKNLMKTGMRLISPGCREEGALNNGWLEQFITKAKAQDVRVDAIAVHWYDWGSNPVGTPSATGAQVFARFQNYIETVYAVHGLPIWITEFNANPARSITTNAAFMALALPWLDSLSYIERYAWFPYNTNTHYYGWDDLTDTQTNTTKTSVGNNYMNHAAAASIGANTVNANNNLTLTTCTNCN